ncbi:MAG: T9SS type A sorting domain-containing protein [candidate division WOR-3 bacterium]|nr:T9SS type A sorting domain-containing protein [candidate division WOR-3 bacterium]
MVRFSYLTKNSNSMAKRRRRILTRHILLILHMGILTFSAFAENWKTYTNTNFIYQIVGDSNYLYCATNGGLVTFSLTSREFTKTVTNTAGLLSNRVYRIAFDINNNIWLGTYKGLTVFDRGLESLLGHHLLGTGESNIVNALAIVGETVFVGTKRGLFAIITKKTNSLIDDSIVPIQLPANFSASIFSLFYHEGLWVGVTPGLIKINDNFSIAHTYPHPLGDSVKAIKLVNDTIYFITELGISRIIGNSLYSVITFPTPMIVFDFNYYDNRFYLATIQGTWEGFNNNLRLIYPEDTRSIFVKDGLWLGIGGQVFRGGGLRYYYNGGWQEFKVNGIEFNIVTCALADNQGSLYALHYPVSYRTISYKPLNGNWQILWDSIPNSYVGVIDPSNRIWFGHWILNGGVSCYDPHSKNWIDVRQWNGYVGVVGALGVDNNGVVWFHNQANSLIAYSNGNYYDFTMPGLSRPERYGYELIFDSSNRLWLGFSGGLAMYNYNNTLSNPADDSYYIYTKGLPTNKEINTVAIAANGQIWCGTDAGVAILEKDSFVMLNRNNSPLINDQIKRIRSDPYGGMWILTSQGLSYYNIYKNEWKNYTSSNSGLIPNNDNDDKFYQWLFYDKYCHRVIIATKEGLCEVYLSRDSINELSNVIIYPNPFIKSYHNKIIFSNVPLNSIIEIFDLTGNLIKKFDLCEYTVEWIPKNISSGLYFAYIYNPILRRSLLMKFAVIY